MYHQRTITSSAGVSTIHPNKSLCFYTGCSSSPITGLTTTDNTMATHGAARTWTCTTPGTSFEGGLPKKSFTCNNGLFTNLNTAKCFKGKFYCIAFNMLSYLMKIDYKSAQETYTPQSTFKT